ncbi:MAG: UPF0104 family protein [Desulfomonile tiedjei]|nr:UPF0104 family protein [Desulfomonile tiedjei]
MAQQFVETTAETPESSLDAARHRFSSLLGYVIIAAFLILCGHYVVTNRADFAFLATVSLPELAAAGLFILVSYTINACQLSVFLRYFGIRLGFVEIMAVTGGMLLGNMVIPMRGGTGGLAIYLKKVHHLDFSAFATIYGGTALLVALINTGLAGVGLILLGCIHGFVNSSLAFIVGAIFCGLLYLSVFPPPVKWNGTGFVGMILDAINAWHVLVRNRRLLMLQLVTTVGMALATMAAFYMVYLSLGAHFPLSAVLISSSMGIITNIVPLTPGSLGIFDAVVIQIPQVFGLDLARSIAGALVFRVLTFSWALALGMPGVIYVMRGRRGEKTEDVASR